MIKKMTLMLAVFALSSFVIAQQAQDKPSGEEKQKATNPVVKIVTTKGDILIELDAAKAPISVSNFLEYTKSGFYEGTIFHRVIKGFMIQGGGFTPDMQQKKPNPPIKNEAANGLKNKRGTIAMARTNIPDSATCQFFINHKDNAFLDYRDPSPQGIGYAVFGKVIKGMDVVDAISDVSTRQKGPHANVPAEPVVIESVTLIQDKTCDAQKKPCCEKEKKECKKQDKEDKSTEKTE